MNKYINTFIENLVQRYKLLFLFIKSTLQTELAYVSEGWGGVISVVVFNITNVVFIDVIYSNLDSLAGYSRDEMLFFILFTQGFFYLFTSISVKNMGQLGFDIKNGGLDKVLTMPMPLIYYTTFRKMSILFLLRDALPGLLFLLFSIRWENLSTIEFSNLVFGICIFIFGYISFSAVLHIFIYFAFWIGESSSVAELPLYMQGDIGNSVPYGAWDNVAVLKNILMFTPFLYGSSIASSVALGQTSPLPSIFFALTIAIFFCIVQNFIWKKGLQNYSSASS